MPKRILREVESACERARLCAFGRGGLFLCECVCVGVNQCEHPIVLAWVSVCGYVSMRLGARVGG